MNDLCQIELFEIELLDHLTECKKMTDFYLNCFDTKQYLELFNFVDIHLQQIHVYQPDLSLNNP